MLNTPGWAERDRRRVDGIDLLRGLSVLLVVMNHVNMRLLSIKLPYTRGLPDQLVYSLVWNGQFGVQMFFVISGFLITSTSIKRWGTPARLQPKAFYTLRFARIGPLLLLLVSLLGLLHLAGVSGYVVSQTTGGLAGALFAALTFHINYLEATRDYLPGNWDILWSLSVEEMFYLFFPIAAVVLRRRWALILLLICFIVAGPFARVKTFNPNPVWREYSYFGGMDAIAIGCLTAMLTAGRRLSRGTLLALGWVGMALLVFSLCFSLEAYQWGLGKSGLNMSVLAAGAALVIVAATQSRWQAPGLFKPVLLLGERSYEMYLTHMFAVMALFAGFVHFGKPLRGVPLLFVSAILAAAGLGWLVAVLFTEPVNRIIRSYAGAGDAQPAVDYAG